MEKIKEKIKLENITKLLFIVVCIMFTIPSVNYLIQKGTILGFNKEFKFLLNNTDTVKQTTAYILILSAMTILYFLIIKRREKIFKNTKTIFRRILLFRSRKNKQQIHAKPILYNNKRLCRKQ